MDVREDLYSGTWAQDEVSGFKEDATYDAI